MSKLTDLRACSTVGDLAALLGFKAKALGYIVRGLPDSAKYTTFEIPKRSGGKRTIHAPIPQLRLAQRRLSALLQDCQEEIETELNVKKHLAHGFKRKHSILTNADVHRRQRFVLNFDLENFFGTINFGRVRGFFSGNRHFKLNPNVASLIAQLACHESKLPQGAPSSPVISNMIGHILDIRLAKLARASGCSYSRYADDITLSTSAPEFPPGIAQQVAGTHTWTLSKQIADSIAACGFRINDAKTRLLHRRSRQDVTGIVVNRHVNVNSDYRRKLRAMVHRIRSVGSFVRITSALDAPGSTKVEEKAGTRAQLQGMLAFAIQVERYRLGPSRAPEELTANERLLQRYLFYTNFACADRATVMFEGKTDNIYLACALRSLASAYPALMSPETGTPFIRLLRSTEIIERLFNLTGGDGPLKDFVKQYAEEYRHIRGPRGEKPLIVVFDNDAGSKGVLSMLQKFYKISTPDGTQFFRANDNLYVVLTSPKGGGSHCIEDCFDAATRAMTIGGKTLNLSNKSLLPTEYGKAWFAEKVIRPNEKTIDFSGFKGLLTVISHIVTTHAPVVKPPK